MGPRRAQQVINASCLCCDAVRSQEVLGLAKAYIKMYETLKWYGWVDENCVEQSKMFDPFVEDGQMLAQTIYEYGERARNALKEQE